MYICIWAPYVVASVGCVDVLYAEVNWDKASIGNANYLDQFKNAVFVNGGAYCLCASSGSKHKIDTAMQIHIGFHACMSIFLYVHISPIYVRLRVWALRQSALLHGGGPRVFF